MDNIMHKKLDLKAIKIDLMDAIFECSQRGLNHNVKWFAELNYSLKNIHLTDDELPTIRVSASEEESAYHVAKAYFDLGEYDRCAYFLKDADESKHRFLHLYAKYLSIEKKKMDNMSDVNNIKDPTKNQPLKDLYTEIKQDYQEKALDGYSLYLYGVVLKKLDLHAQAIEILVESINALPLLWSSWQELALLIPHKDKLETIHVPDIWIKHFFIGFACLDRLNNDDALEVYSHIHSQGFENSSYVLAQTANVYHNRRELEKAVETFEELIKLDPYRLDDLDVYSNLLYVKELKYDLADLAHKAVNIDKYRVETCCIIGNYYSLRSDHAKAVLYFQRALKLNPLYLSAWTLMGHEFMEMKNTNAAIQSYRQAIEINRNDYRAWYGIGQTYEILKMYHYCKYYYQQSQRLRPNDSRMVIALGEIYEKLDKTENALKCYYKACTLGDMEGLALLKLAKLYDKLDLTDNAAAAFTEYCSREDNFKSGSYEDQAECFAAFLYLANYHLKEGDLDSAYCYAFKCMENEETKEQAKGLLKSIALKRGETEAPVVIEETEGNQSVTNQTAGSNMDISF